MSAKYQYGCHPLSFPFFRWGFHTHGCIDGFSRFILYLECETSCDAYVVLKHFVRAATRYGVPSRVRSDYGGENVDIALLMNLLRGITRGSHLTGESVHNERIERLWRDVHKDATSLIYEELYSLEDDNKLDVDSEIDRFAVKFVYLPVINKQLQSFRMGWNCHSLRTEKHKTPQQLWIEGILNHADTSRTAVNEFFEEQESLENRIMERFPLLNVSEDDSTQRNGQNVSSCGLSDQQLIQLKAVLENIEGRKEKYLSCVATMKEMLSN